MAERVPRYRSVSPDDNRASSTRFGSWTVLILQWLRAVRGGRLTTYRDRYRIACLLSLLPCNLSWLLHLFGSDKQQTGGHSYGSTYQAMFRRFRYRNIKFAEIGVLDGASLLAWRAFFPRAAIFGYDIMPKEHFENGRIAIRLMDQASARDLAAIAEQDGPFDIIIDDGSHKNEHQIFTFYEMYDKLTPDGIYIIEDVQTSFWPGPFGGAGIHEPGFRNTCVHEFTELAKYVNHSEFRHREGLDERRMDIAQRVKSVTFEHNLIIVQRGWNDVGSNYEYWVETSGGWKDMA